MNEAMFVRFHEECDWEGESWDFWLQLDGNEEELANLAVLLRNGEVLAEDDDEGEDSAYSLNMEAVEPESVVDKLVQYAERGYYQAHTKVTGEFVCPDTLAGDRLYKGGIKKFFRPA